MNAVQSFTFYMYIFYLIGHIFDFIKYLCRVLLLDRRGPARLPPDPRGGAYVMALSFGLYFVFPLSYIAIATLFMPHANSDIVSLQNVGGTYQYICALPATPDVSMLNCGRRTPATRSLYPSMLKSMQNVLDQVLTVQLDGLGKHMIYVICIFPLIAFTILLTFVSTPRRFRRNIPEIGRGIVKLI